MIISEKQLEIVARGVLRQSNGTHHVDWVLVRDRGGDQVRLEVVIGELLDGDDTTESIAEWCERCTCDSYKGTRIEQLRRRGSIELPHRINSL